MASASHSHNSVRPSIAGSESAQTSLDSMSNVLKIPESHPLAECFPLLEGEEFERLKRDIEEHGQCVPVWLFGSRVLDGRNRERACAELGIECLGRAVEDAPWYDAAEFDPATFVVSMNLHRRHLSEAQRAAIGAKLVPELASKAKERQREAGKKVGRGQDEPVAAHAQGDDSDAAAQ